MDRARRLLRGLWTGFGLLLGIAVSLGFALRVTGQMIREGWGATYLWQNKFGNSVTAPAALVSILSFSAALGLALYGVELIRRRS